VQPDSGATRDANAIRQATIKIHHGERGAAMDFTARTPSFAVGAPDLGIDEITAGRSVARPEVSAAATPRPHGSAVEAGSRGGQCVAATMAGPSLTESGSGSGSRAVIECY
jgi:hypothetical protein